MKRNEQRILIQSLHEQGCAIREISRKVGVSRNMVRRTVKASNQKAEKAWELPVSVEQLREIYHRCKANGVRIKEVLEEEHECQIGYSTLTRILREARLRPGKQRVGRYQFDPGEEMQHDTSPHRLMLGERKVVAQCAALYLGYSRYLYMRYYPHWTRFEARCFLSEALAFWGGAAGRCIIDNSSVVLAGGSGPDAIMAPEMEVLGRCYGFHFQAHRVGDPQRKGGVERVFSYVERNFLAGRTFQNWQDLNQQAADWCQLSNRKLKRDLGMSPEAALVIERPFLKPLPRHLPPIYQLLARVVDTQGYVCVDTNRYSTPEHLVGKRVEVHKEAQELKIYFKGKQVAKHPRCQEKRRAVIKDPKHHGLPAYQRNPKGPAPQEQLLRGQAPVLDAYLDALKQRYRGRGIPQLKRLLNLMRTYPRPSFLQAVEQADHYGLYDLARLEQMILSQVAGEFFRLELEGDDLCI